jgi:hypothetical protein
MLCVKNSKYHHVKTSTGYDLFLFSFHYVEEEELKSCWMTLGTGGYSHLKDEALDSIKWRNRFGKGCGPDV